MPRQRVGVVLLIPPPVAGEIDVLRRAVGDDNVDRIAPHLTLVPPVNVHDDDYGSALELLRDAAHRTKPFTLVLGPPRRAQNVWVLSPLMIPAKHHWPLVRALNQFLLRATVSRFARSKRFATPVVWTYHPFMLDAIRGLQRGPLVYHCVDDIGAVPGVDVDAFGHAQRLLLGTSDAVFTTAPALQSQCAPHNPNTHYFGNVVDALHFGTALDEGPLPPELAAIPEPRLVYHGVLSDFKIDMPLLLAVAKARQEWHWVIIGEEREGQRSPLLAEFARLPNAHLLGYRNYRDLPAYLRGMRVGVLPPLLNDYTRSMFPMKFYEYLAAGLPIMSWAREGASPDVFYREHYGAHYHNGSVAEGTDAFIRSIMEATPAHRRQRYEAARQILSEQFSYSSELVPFRDFLVQHV